MYRNVARSRKGRKREKGRERERKRRAEVRSRVEGGTREKKRKKQRGRRLKLHHRPFRVFDERWLGGEKLVTRGRSERVGSDALTLPRRFVSKLQNS